MILGILFLGETLTLASASGLILILIVIGVAAINGQIGRIVGLLRRNPISAAKS